MRIGKSLAVGASLLLAAALGRVAAVAGDSAPTTWNLTSTDGTLEGIWAGPHWWGDGPGDYMNARYDGLLGRPINGVSIAAYEYSEGATFDFVGLFDANLGLDPSGNTPDLIRGITTIGPVFGGDLDYVYATFGGTYRPSSEPQHVVVQMNPDNWGLWVAYDEDDPRGNFSGWTWDGYITPAIDAWADLAMNVNVDICQEFSGTGGRLGFYRELTDETGDFVTTTTHIDEELGSVFFAPAAGSLWMLFLSVAGVPVAPVSAPLPTVPDGSCGYLRTGTIWPYGFGGMTFHLIAASAVPGVRGSAGISNEVTLSVLADPVCTWGVKDDGTYEDRFAVWPPDADDYFSTWFNCRTPPVVDLITDMKVAVFDYGTTATSFPASGVFAANLALDPTGWTPDLAAGYEVGPFTFPAGVLASTSGQLVVRDFPDIPYSSLPDDNVHGVIQFPPGEPRFLGIGADTTPTLLIEWGSAWSNDGYATPAQRYDHYAGWGLRLGSR
ncbi:MAG: hypothetical protein AB1486_19300 [Planctomycetota bacterium]